MRLRSSADSQIGNKRGLSPMLQLSVDQVFESGFSYLVELIEPQPLNWMDHLIKLIAEQR